MASTTGLVRAPYTAAPFWLIPRAKSIIKSWPSAYVCAVIDVRMVPAMYNRNAYEVSFDEGFSEIIRKPGSWRDSEGFEILRKYDGRMLVIGAEKDDVIPKEVIEQYFWSGEAASFRRIYVAPGVGHMVFTELREKDPAEMERIVDMIAGELKYKSD